MQPHRKGFLIRLAALIIDLIVAVVVYFIVMIAVLLITGTKTKPPNSVILGIFWGAIIALLFCEVLFAQSIGKAILRLSIAKFDCTPAPTSALVSRWLIKTWPAWLFLLDAIAPNELVLFVGGVGSLAMGISFLAVMNDGKQGWHDQMTGTAVYRTVDVDGPDDRPGGFEVEMKE